MTWHQIVKMRSGSGELKPRLTVKRKKAQRKIRNHLNAGTIICILVALQVRAAAAADSGFFVARKEFPEAAPSTQGAAPGPAMPAASTDTGGETVLSSENEVEYDINFDNVCNFDLLEPQLFNDTNVKGSLNRNKNWWIKNAGDQWIVETVLNGYTLPFVTKPDSVHLKNNKSAIDNMDFVKEAVSELLASGRIIEATEKPYVINPLTVAINDSGKRRLVLDLRHINIHLWKNKSTYEGTETLLNYLEQDCFLTSLDMKSGYHHIDINKEQWTYLGFSFEENNIQKHFTFTVLPFGLSTAGYVFTRTMNCIIRQARMHGIKVIAYLDDVICVANSQEDSERCTHNVINTFKDAGFIVNKEKSSLNPCQKLQWLGFVFDTIDCKISIPTEKLIRIRRHLSRHLSMTRLSTRQLASVVGKITSLRLALGNIVFLKTKFCQKVIAEQRYWEQKLRLTNECKQEIQFWIKNVCIMNTVGFQKCVSFDRIVYSDASAVGCGGYIVTLNNSEMFVPWAENEKSKSSTWRELKAVSLMCKAYKGEFANKRIKWYTDNANVVKIANHGSMVMDLQRLAIEVYNVTVDYNFELVLEWIPREQNMLADKLSKDIDVDDWSVSNHIFEFARKRWGNFSCDMFANHLNCKTNKFYSKHWCPDSTGVDAFAFSWNGEFSWIVPPVTLLTKVIRKIKEDKASGVLIFPNWKKAAFWPLLFKGNGTDSMIKDMITYVKPRNFFVKGSSKKSVFAQEQFLSNVTMCYFSADV